MASHRRHILSNDDVVALAVVVNSVGTHRANIPSPGVKAAGEPEDDRTAPCIDCAHFVDEPGYSFVPRTPLFDTEFGRHADECVRAWLFSDEAKSA